MFGTILDRKKEKQQPQMNQCYPSTEKVESPSTGAQFVKCAIMVAMVGGVTALALIGLMVISILLGGGGRSSRAAHLGSTGEYGSTLKVAECR